jgi:hypothetical protein
VRFDPKLRAGLLIAGVVATAGAMYWVDSASDTQVPRAGKVVEGAKPMPRRAAAREATPPAVVPYTVVNGASLDLSRLQRAGSTRPGSDPFGRRVKPAPAQRRELPPSGPVQAVAAPPLPPPSAPPVPFAYIGRLSEEDRTTVFLSAGERNLVVKPGDVVDNNYRVEEVTDNAVSLTYLPLNVKQTIPTGAQ